MMAKFCKIFENDKGAQLLVLIQQSTKNHDLAEFQLIFELDDDSQVTLTVMEITWDKAEEALENYGQQQAENVLVNPLEFVKGLLN